MNRKIKYNYIICLFAILISFGLSSCKWETITPVEVVIPEEGVSFSADIQPIFTSKCITCHSGNSPILTQGNAYASLISGGYIDTDNPASSGIYLQTTSGHPGGSSAFTPTENALLYAWIEEGAENN